MHRLPRTFYNRDAETVAQELLGMQLVRRKDGIEIIGRIVETEAYLGPHDLAAHSARDRTPRTEVMFGPPGYAYVYLIYGMYHCMNVVTEEAGMASAVLIRALEPIQNISLNTKGPGLLCKAMGIDKNVNGHDLLSNDFFLTEPPTKESFGIIARPRIGVDYAGEWATKPLRFYIADNPYVSRK
ncbi:MAG: DNA-3-methyladenine glycosylase [Candidatus Peribacteria bacterium]|nr:DNA-3-methyladenine glycosylase [Candidatus Peribacteria bacterium]